MKQMKPKKKRKQNVAASRPLVVIPYAEKVSETVGPSQDHEKIQCTLCYETMGYSQEYLGTPQRS